MVNMQTTDHHHVAMLPSPGMGHLIPMVELAKKLVLEHGFSATLIIPDSGNNTNQQKTFLDEELPKGMNFNYIFLDPPPSFHHDINNADLTNNLEMRVAMTIPLSLSSIFDAIKSLKDNVNLVALVIDLFGTPAFDVANEFNITPYIFFPSNAMALSLFMYLPKFDASVSCENYRDLQEPIQFPGSSIPLRAEDFPLHNRQSAGYKWFLNNVKRYKMAKGILVNTFHDMEAKAIESMQEEEFRYPPIYPIGPLTNTTKHALFDHDDSSNFTLKWLDDQPLHSILFICFGSFGSLSNAQLHELACGIEMSGQGFVWVVRNSSSNDDQAIDFLPNGFSERTESRGLLVSNWAPQAKILSHESVGGFLTHCGWNSILESIVNGVPMIAWPLYAEQKMNAAIIAEDLKIALRPQSPKINSDESDGLLGRFVIANAMKNLMEGEQGKHLRRRIEDLKDAAAKAIKEDGSSTKCMADFASQLKEKFPA